MTSKQRSIAYLISQYPAVSHTFIQREIETLTQEEFQIHIASINQSDSTSEGSAQNVYYVKSQGFLKSIFALFSCLIFHPILFFKALFTSFQMAGLDLKRLLYHLFYLGEAALVAEWMGQLGSKHLHVHFANPASTVALLVTKLRPYTFSITIHGPDEFYDIVNNNLPRKFREAQFLCCIGFYARSQIMRLLPPEEWSKIEITPMGIDANQYLPPLDRSSESTFTISCVGRLHVNKGQLILLEAIANLVKEGIDCKIHLIGDGADKITLSKRVDELNLRNFVSFEGPLKPKFVKEFLTKTDLFILPSFAEGIPVSLMEAMSMEIPCISTSINGIPELIQDGVNGVLVSPSDVVGLANKIRQLYEDPHFRRRLGENGRKTILEKWQLTTNVRKIAEVFHKYEGKI